MTLKASFVMTSGMVYSGKTASLIQLNADGSTSTVVDVTTDDLGAAIFSMDTYTGVAYAVQLMGFPVLSTVQGIDADGALSLGTLIVSDRPMMAVTAFYTSTTGGYVYGCPQELYTYVKGLVDAASSGGGATGDDGTTTEEEPPAMEKVLTAISAAIASASSDSSGRASSSGYSLSSVRVNAKCLLSSKDGSVSLDFLDKDALASVDAAHLSEVEVAYVPPRSAVSTGTSTVDSAVPSLTGYTRELALRKVRAAGMVPELNNVAVTSADQVGRVVGQSPLAGEAPSSDTVVKLYLGIQRS